MFHEITSADGLTKYLDSIDSIADKWCPFECKLSDGKEGIYLIKKTSKGFHLSLPSLSFACVKDTETIVKDGVLYALSKSFVLNSYLAKITYIRECSSEEVLQYLLTKRIGTEKVLWRVTCNGEIMSTQALLAFPVEGCQFIYLDNIYVMKDFPDVCSLNVASEPTLVLAEVCYE